MCAEYSDKDGGGSAVSGPTSGSGRLCPFPFHEMVVFAEGYASTCCYFIGSQFLDGNEAAADGLCEVSGRSLSSLWASGEFEGLRERMLRGDLPALCRNCAVTAASYREFATMKIETGDVEGALGLFEESIEGDGRGDREATVLAGKCLILLKRFDEALPLLRKAVSLCPPEDVRTRVTALDSEVQCLLETHREDEAAAVLAGLFKERPAEIGKLKHPLEVLFKAGRIMKEQGRFAAALTLFEQSRSLGWRGENALAELSECLKALGREAETQRYAERYSLHAEAAFLVSVRGASFRGRILDTFVREGRFDDALGLCGRIVAAGVADLVVLGAMSRSALAAGAAREAMDELDRADAGKLWIEAEKNERAEDALRWIVRCAEACDRDDLALKYIEPLRQSGFTKSSSDLLRTCVGLFEKCGLRGEAIAALRGCGDAIGRIEKARTYLRLGACEEMLNELGGAAGAGVISTDLIDTEDPETLFEIGISCRETGKREAAASFFRAALKAAPDHREAKLNLIDCLIEAGAAEEAVEEASSGGALHEEDVIGLMIRLGFREMALRRLLKCGEGGRFADPAARLYMVARCYKEAGRHRRALRWYGRLLKIRPDRAGAVRDAAECLHDLGRFEEAAQRFEEALSLDPGLEWTMFSLGKTCERLGRIEDAGRWYGKNLELAGQNPLSYFHSCMRLGALLEAAGRHEEAAGMYKAALSWSGGDKEATEALERCRGRAEGEDKR